MSMDKFMIYLISELSYFYFVIPIIQSKIGKNVTV